MEVYVFVLSDFLCVGDTEGFCAVTIAAVHAGAGGELDRAELRVQQW